MKITHIQATLSYNAVKSNNSHKPHNNTVTNPQIRYENVSAYRDFGISFGGRTPENFYEQTFNRENMPATMKEFLNYDYETRQHIPPEQMMQTAFQYLQIADNFDEVKKIYPRETLFENLHENVQNNRTSILAEIKLAKELSDEPILKDGSDDLGMYMLKKIFLEGKTVKEINKDFHEKDMNKAYDGIITRPIDLNTTAAYGIRYPKSAFWNSFIATREEYKKFFVTLPKNTVNPAANLKKTKSTAPSGDIPTQTSEKVVPHKRKYKIKNYQKTQLQSDIKDSKADSPDIERKIRKRFGKDDPEASFIIKYLSPIMTIAADRVHLSEELKAFSEQEKMAKQPIGNDEFMLKRFWKQNLELLDYYAQTITDTIDLFEDIYAEGGLLPINKDLVVVTPEIENQKIIDYINPDFLELLDYTQTIYPERETRYEEHERQQQAWNEHFLNRYGAILPGLEISPSQSKVTGDNTGLQAGENQPLTKISTADLHTPTDIHKAFVNTVKAHTSILPSSFANKYIKHMKTDFHTNDKLKYIQLITRDIADVPQDVQTDFAKELEKRDVDFLIQNRAINEDSFYAELAMLAVLSKYEPLTVHMCLANSLELVNWDAIENNNKIHNILKPHKKEVEETYQKYKIPLTEKEANQITAEMYEQLLKYAKTPQAGQSYCEPNLRAVLKMLGDATDVAPRVDSIKNAMKKMAQKYTYSRVILEPNLPPEAKRALFEDIMYIPILDFLRTNEHDDLLLLIGEDHFLAHNHELAPDFEMEMIAKISRLPEHKKELFKITKNNYQQYLEKYFNIQKDD